MESKVIKFLTGYKTYIVGALSVVLGVLALFNIELFPTIVTHATAAQFIETAVLAVFIRSGVAANKT